ncbi:MULTISPECIES: acyl carrier protein [Streptomyces]|uniref:Acyl carrier protein n=1 Tax=Streptomyces albidocamelliae TaxID=2981135 RepID=A0ABY6EZB4_9ACTN|nr:MULTISPECIES: acyl carrier protein [unclassified Streptomyces]OKJ78859.1 actinorhodin polyketide synthase [Streptomyces sp. CB01883]UXY39551.1 acyl carrier protein [Streptomyces sp. HUAS 14-6]
MATLDIEDLRRILVDCAGEEEGAEVSGATLDTPFEELGYDSLALMETAAAIQDEYGIVLPDEDVSEARTPRNLLDLANGAVRTGG